MQEADRRDITGDTAESCTHTEVCQIVLFLPHDNKLKYFLMDQNLIGRGYISIRKI